MNAKIDEQKKWYEKFELFIVAGCLLLFSGLILASLNRSSVWHDEGYTAVLIENNYGGIIERTALDVHPPFYYVALKTWSLIFGDSVMVLRLFSAVCMLGSMLIVWRIIKKLFGTQAGLLALLFMSMGPFIVRYGQEMRMYGLAALLASVATWLYVDSLQRKKISTSKSLAYAIVIAAGLYSQYFFILVPASHVIHALLTGKGTVTQRLGGLKKYLLSVVVAVLLFLPWVPTVLSQFKEVQGAFWIGPVGVETLTSTPVAMTLFKKQFEMTGVEGLVAVLTLAMLVVVIRQFMSRHNKPAHRVLFLSIIVPPALLFLLSVPPFQPSYQDRYMSFFAPVFYAVLAVGVLAFVSRKLKLVAMVAVLAVLAYGQWNNYWNGNNHGWQPSPYFTMNNIIDLIDNKDPVYSTSLWTYFDARTVLRDRGMSNTNQVLLNEMPTKWKGNMSAIYKRPELVTTTIPDSVRSFWFIDESSKSQYSGDALNGFYQQRSYYVDGYAKITRFVRE